MLRMISFASTVAWLLRWSFYLMMMSDGVTATFNNMIRMNMLLNIFDVLSSLAFENCVREKTVKLIKRNETIILGVTVTTQWFVWSEGSREEERDRESSPRGRVKLMHHFSVRLGQCRRQSIRFLRQASYQTLFCAVSGPCDDNPNDGRNKN